jgi:molecular chaperone HscB
MWLWRKLQCLTSFYTSTDNPAVSRSENNHFDNYFTLFGLNEGFGLDRSALDSQYKALQSQYHPDKFADAEDSQRLKALQQTSLVNDAYETLKSPLKRAAYLLKLNDVDPEEHNQAHFGEAFLIRQMELREALETLSASEDIDGLEAMKAEAGKEKDTAVAAFEKQFMAKEFASAKSTYNQMQFLFKLLDEIDSVEEKLLDY